MRPAATCRPRLLDSRDRKIGTPEKLEEYKTQSGTRHSLCYFFFDIRICLGLR
jgi:hypothetical protein